MVVLHYTAMGSARAARDWLCTPDAQVSAHYVISRQGTCWHLVEEAARAWHAGAGAWGAVRDVNSRSIGIELANTGTEPFAEPQMRALETLLRGILRRWSIPPARVIGHSDMAPGRKIDPGRRFDWARLARQGLAEQGLLPQGVMGPRACDGAWCDLVEAQDMLRALVRVGYTHDVALPLRLAAFRARHRPTVADDGPATARDLAVAEALPPVRGS
ncbi:MAG: N-acetylmuramoyl-L-alanine amidase [Paracoccaceae bacterium]